MERLGAAVGSSEVEAVGLPRFQAGVGQDDGEHEDERGEHCDRLLGQEDPNARRSGGTEPIAQGSLNYFKYGGPHGVASRADQPAERDMFRHGIFDLTLAVVLTDQLRLYSVHVNVYIRTKLQIVLILKQLRSRFRPGREGWNHAMFFGLRLGASKRAAAQ